MSGVVGKGNRVPLDVLEAEIRSWIARADGTCLERYREREASGGQTNQSSHEGRPFQGSVRRRRRVLA